MANPNAVPPEHSKFKKGQSGNPAGRPKGALSWSTIVKEILADEKLFEKIIAGKKNPEWLKDLPARNAGNAIVGAMVTNALQGDKASAEWLRKTGFGDKLDLSSEQPLTVALVEFVNADDKAKKD